MDYQESESSDLPQIIEIWAEAQRRGFDAEYERVPEAPDRWRVFVYAATASEFAAIVAAAEDAALMAA